MTPQQREALTHPCRFAFETPNVRYHRDTDEFSIHLTVNSGWE